MRIPRSRGAVSGVMLIILGLFGALLPLVGPYFDFTIGADSAWNFGEGHVWLSVVPGVVVALGGLILLTSAHRAGAGFGAWIALLGGIWFVVGEQVSQLWNDGASIAGEAAGGTGQRVAEHLAYFDALGALIITFAALALGRLAVRSVRDVELAHEAERDRGDDIGAVNAPAPRPTRESGRFDRDEDRAADAGDTARTDTMTAAERVREAARRTDDGKGRGLFRRRNR